MVTSRSRISERPFLTSPDPSLFFGVKHCKSVPSTNANIENMCILTVMLTVKKAGKYDKNDKLLNNKISDSEQWS